PARYQSPSPMLQARKARPNSAASGRRPSPARPPATMRVGTAGTGRPTCSSSTLTKTVVKPGSLTLRMISDQGIIFAHGLGGQEMPTAWVLNAVGLYATTVGALLIYMHLRRPLPIQILNTEERTAYERHQRRLRLGVGLLAAWLLIQDIALIVL